MFNSTKEKINKQGWQHPEKTNKKDRQTNIKIIE